MNENKAREAWFKIIKIYQQTNGQKAYDEGIAYLTVYGAECRAQGIGEMRDAAMDLPFDDYRYIHEDDIKRAASRLLPSVPPSPLLTEVPMPEGAYYRCAVCEGRGSVPPDNAGSTTTVNIPCRACGGVGQLWRPFSAPPEQEEYAALRHVGDEARVIAQRNVEAREHPAPDKLAGLRDAWWGPCKEHGVHNCGEDGCKLDAFAAALEVPR